MLAAKRAFLISDRLSISVEELLLSDSRSLMPAVIAALEKHLGTAASWVSIAKTDVLFAVLEQDRELRAQIAGILKGAGYFSRILEDSVRAVQRQPALMESTFQAYAARFVDPAQPEFPRNLFFALQHDFGFRNEVASLIDFSSPEGIELAEFFIATLKTARAEDAKDALIAKLLAAFPSLGKPVETLLSDPETNRAVLMEALSVAFAKDPSVCAKFWEDQRWPVPFPLVLRKEIALITDRRCQTANHAAAGKPTLVMNEQPFDAYEWANHAKLAGLAFSGGGIRSATFNLGVLQALASLKILDKFDYLSSVSGGGYVAAWMAGWLSRGSPDEQNRQQPFPSFAEFDRLLSPEASADPQATPLRPLRYLRQFSNYLTPQLGLFGFDTWTMAAVYLRNVLLNQATLVAGIGALLLVPRWIGAPLIRWCGTTKGSSLWILAIAVILLVLAMFGVGRNLATATADPCIPPPKPEKDRAPQPSTLRFIQWFLVLPFLFASGIASQWFWINIRSEDLHKFVSWDTVYSMSFFAILSFILSWAGGVAQCFKGRPVRHHASLAWALMAGVAVVCGFVGALLLQAYSDIMLALANLAPSAGGAWHAIVLGPALLMSVLVLIATLHVGLLGVDLPDAAREWLSRFRAVGSLYLFFWLVLFGASLYGPLVIAWIGEKSQLWVEGAGAAWLATTAASVLAGRSGKTGTTKEGAPTFNKLDLLARIGPPVFAIGFILAISMGEHLLLSRGAASGGYSFSALVSQHWGLMDTPWTDRPGFPLTGLLSLMGTLVASALLLAWRVDINEFSMHHFYKNRLVRCYLGASNSARKPNPFTGFDQSDDVFLADLIPSDPTEANAGASTNYLGPYPIVNATLNLSDGEQLAIQERKAASFFFSPCFSGYDLALLRKQAPALKPPNREDFKYAAYRSTSDYGVLGGIRLGTAMAISGAAADPNQGFNTSTAVAFLMTVFDVRLGWWLGNPRWDGAAWYSSPRFGLNAMISELLGLTNDRNSFVSLSDGGHFDNLGLYELVRRRCKFIVVCDAEQDFSYSFGSLGSAIRRCRVDFGAEIDLDLRRIRPQTTGAKRSEAHCAIGSITYLDHTTGTLFYIKSSLTGDEPQDIMTYAQGHRTFPHETTADQWFSESQFESYRKLGYHATLDSFTPAMDGAQQSSGGLNRIFEDLRRHWYQENPNLHANAGDHTRAFNQLLESIRSNRGLHALGAQIFPEAGFADHMPAVSDTDRFFFCMRLLQLAEDIYFDLHLEIPAYRDDPKIEGWLTLFRQWSQADPVKKTWKSESLTFQNGFRVFWTALQDGA